MLPELVEKFQSFIDNLTKGVQELVDDIFGEENENENEPILVSNTMYCQFLITAAGYEVVPTTWNNYCRMIYTCDLKVFNNTITVDVNPLGRYKDSKVYWDNIGGNAEACESAINQQVMETFEVYKARNEDVYVRFGQYDCTVTLYYGTPPSYHDGEVYKRIKNDRNEELKSYYCYPYFNLITYTIDGNGYVDVDTQYLDPWIDRCACIKTHPVVMTCNNPSTITQYVTDSGSTNNYHTTYTTTGGDSVDIYYGDSYIIVNNNGHDTSYDDLKNMLDIAINQINEDNDTDIKVPTYRENKYGPEPPTPPDPDDDDIDKQDMGVGTNLGGLGGYWLLTKAQLSDLHDALDTAPVGFDPLNSFISLMGLGVDASKVLDATQFQYVTPINIRMSDGTTWQTGVEAHIISSNEIVSAFNSDTFRIQRKYNNFLDYSPYATHELFIPMCGWVTLPDIAVDRDIIVTYIPDIESCKCRAVVSVVSNSEGDNDACVIAEKDGIMGSDVPFSNVGHSLFVGDAIINGANVAGEAITMAIGAGFTKTGASGKTFRPYEGFTLGGSGTLPSAIGNALVSGNINRTHFITGNSTKTGFSDGESIIVKSVYHIPDMPDNYAHTVGLVCNKTGQLTEFNGFTVCDNPHITFSALEAEKEEIKRLLEEGVILPIGE